MHTLAELIRRNRLLWGGGCWLHTGLLLGYGVTYVVFGPSSVPSTGQYAVFVQYVPGGLKTYGVIMLLFALVMLYGLAAPLYGQPMVVQHIRLILLWYVGYDVLLAWLFAWSWGLSGVVTALSIITWLAFAAFAFLLRKEAPKPDDWPRRGQ